MTHSNTPITITFFVLGGSFLILAIPVWMTYVLMSSVAVIFIIHAGYKHSKTTLLAWRFFTEFFGFCLLVALFVGTTVMMNGLLSA